MSAGLVLSQFEALAARTESMLLKLTGRKIRPTRDQRDEFRKLRGRMDSSWAALNAAIAKLNHCGDEDIAIANQIRDTKNYQSITSPILMNLRRNLELIYIGPKDSELDSEQVKTRKRHTRTRCGVLRSQHPHVILMWAMALPPSSWKTSGGMPDGTFDFVIDDTYTERIPLLSSDILQTLQSLEKEEPLNTCDMFRDLVSGLSESALANQRETLNPFGKRGHGVESPASPLASNREQQFQGVDYRPYQLPSLRDMGFVAPVYSTYQTCDRNGNGSHTERGRPFSDRNQPQVRDHTPQTSMTDNREGYIYTNAPASSIAVLPEPFKTAVQNSKLWIQERRQGLEKTGCLATLFPKDDTQDISLTISCASEDGYRLNSIYGMEVTMSF
ncbi:hypothetical protein ACJ73_08658 [Blastomyces percursus]|uniref:Uncharacterized protein n=1 Tax=Blastomyces percursus TaxID=1658174 RepID=A0A1J9PRW6_9EURO|nr:hypothetical protein ACJ73_08658 [Blastomyces percursus]